MYNDDYFFDVEDMFCSLFVLAGEYKIKEDIFTRKMENHHFIKSIEKGDYNHAYNESLLKIFDDEFSFNIASSDYENKWNDYYWVGKAYFYIQNKTHKSFSYIFLKLPFKELLDLYYPYHETDFSHILDIFNKKKEKTILELLCKRRKISISYLSNKTDIAISTLTKYRKNDAYLFKASFMNIYKLGEYFEVPITLFLDSIPNIKK